MWNSLYNLGMIPNKSLSLKYPDIDPKYDSAFIRGYVDGDGCIYKNYNKVSILGTNDFVSSINNIISDRIGIRGKIYDSSSKNGITKSLEICGKEKVPKFLEWMYSNGDLFLKRKNKIYVDRYVNNSFSA